jgi:hypothetical protein
MTLVVQTLAVCEMATRLMKRQGEHVATPLCGTHSWNGMDGTAVAGCHRL